MDLLGFDRMMDLHSLSVTLIDLMIISSDLQID